MSRFYRLSVVTVIILMIGSFSLSANDNITISKQVFGCGGVVGQRTSGDYTMSGLFGQVAIERITGRYNGDPVTVYQGFWVPMEEPIGVEENPSLSNTNLVNFPNPFNSSTTIRYELPGTSNVTLKIYDVMGHQVRVLVNGTQDYGKQEINWDGKDENGVLVGSGSYLYELNVQPAQLAGSTFQAFNLRNIMIVVR